RKRRHHEELSKCYVGLQCHLHRRIECCRLICRQTEDERTQYTDAMLFEGKQLLRQSLARLIEVLEDRFESFRGYRFDPHQRTLDICPPHGVQILAVLTCLHRDLGEEHHVFRQPCQLFHEQETLRSDRRQLLEFGDIILLPGEPQIGQRYGIEIIVGEGNKPEAKAAQFNDFVDHALILPLPRLLPIGPPNAAKRAMLWASANGLHRGPHIFIARHQVPSRSRELAAFNPSALIDTARLASQAIGHDFAPRNVTITLHDGVSAPAFQSLFGIQSSVNAPVDHPRASSARHPANLISAQSIARMHTDADDISRHYAFRHNRLKRLVDENRIPHFLRRRRRKDKQPSWRNDSGTERIVAGIYEMDTHGLPFPVRTRRLRCGTLLQGQHWLSGLGSPPDRLGTRANQSLQVREQTILAAREKKTVQNCTQVKKA